MTTRAKTTLVLAAVVLVGTVTIALASRAPERLATPPRAAETTTPTTAGVAADSLVERVLHISVDGLRSDFVNADNTPTLQALIDNGAATLNARTDFNATITLPNHAGQLTGRRLRGEDGFKVIFNEDNGGTVHAEAGFYTASSFDVAHDNGLKTFALVGTNKFDFLDRSWNAENGAPDVTGEDNGADKIDQYLKDFSIDGHTDLMLDHLANGPADYIFWHLPHPDAFGHPNGWGSTAYAEAVRKSDASIGAVLAAIAADPNLGMTTAVVVTADHGGELNDTGHFDARDPQNYTVPLIVWGPGVGQGDLYTLNPNTRSDPGTARPDEADVQPVRASEAGNLSMQLLGLPPIPGSRYNASHDLNLN